MNMYLINNLCKEFDEWKHGSVFGKKKRKRPKC